VVFELDEKDSLELDQLICQAAHQSVTQPAKIQSDNQPTLKTSQSVIQHIMSRKLWWL